MFEDVYRKAGLIRKQKLFLFAGKEEKKGKIVI